MLWVDGFGAWGFVRGSLGLIVGGSVFQINQWSEVKTNEKPNSGPGEAKLTIETMVFQRLISIFRGKTKLVLSNTPERFLENDHF